MGGVLQVEGRLTAVREEVDKAKAEAAPAKKVGRDKRKQG